MKNLNCKYYPCHVMEDLQCDFCYCLIYPCGDPKCGKWLENGYWDCSGYTIPHTKAFVLARQAIADGYKLG